jgi:hypothetical protein
MVRLIRKRVAYGKKTSVRLSWSTKADFEATVLPAVCDIWLAARLIMDQFEGRSNAGNQSRHGDPTQARS